MTGKAGNRVAEERIEEARRSGATSLELFGEHLTTLPDSLGELTQLQSLDLSNNELTALPNSLGQLRQLQSLDLNNNKLATLPDSLGELTQLQSLSLSDNELTALPDSLGQLTQLQSLSLSDNELTALPDSLGQLTQLQSLDLSENKLTALPNSLGQLTQLQSLDLSMNKLTALPDSLGRLARLHHLDLSYNEPTALSDSLVQLTQLQSLTLQGMQLARPPEWLKRLPQLKHLDIAYNQLATLPEWIGDLDGLVDLRVQHNQLTDLPVSLGKLEFLTDFWLGDGKLGNPIPCLPKCVRQMKRLRLLSISGCNLSSLPDWIGELRKLDTLYVNDNRLTDLPLSLASFETIPIALHFGNSWNPELGAALDEGVDAVNRYLRAKATAQVLLNEAKLILVGEGEVGKSCLLGALRGDPWKEGRPTTHGIEIKPVKVTNPDTGAEITLNGWDFGGQRVYRPTHQLFFSAPAVYLVVWKPREGPQQGLVKEWIKLVKHREPAAKILVVATHGGPNDRQPDIDRQEIWDLFGKEMVVDFFHVDSRPADMDEKTGKRTGKCSGVAALETAIARVAASLPETHRSVPQSWQKARTALKDTREPYLPFGEVLTICKECGLEEESATDFVSISHRLGHLIHYGHDPDLREIVILKPDWLATAISFVLDDKETRDRNGLVNAQRLARVWNDPGRPQVDRYPSACYPIFRSLMERYDLCYRIAEGDGPRAGIETILVAQLVPDVRPADKLAKVWPPVPGGGELQQTQICKILDAKHQSAGAEGMFFWLIVRLHKYSLGRVRYDQSVHWQRGLVLEDTYGARALLEHIDNDVRITVRSPYPERFLSALTYEVQWLVESFWKNLRCAVTVPCLNPLGQDPPCPGVFEVSQLLENKRRQRTEQPCGLCNEWQNIEELLHNAPAARPDPLKELLLSGIIGIQSELKVIAERAATRHNQLIGRFDQAESAADARAKEILSKVEAAYDGLMRTIVDEAKEGPRLFSFEAVEPGFWDRPKWMSAKYRFTLWCEHSRLPLPALNGQGDERGIYEITLPRDWVVKSAPFLKALSTTLSLVLPIASAGIKLAMDDKIYKGIEKQLGLAEKCVDAVLKGGDKAGEWLAEDDAPGVEQGKARDARGAVLRQIQAWLKEKDPGFGGLVRVQNKRHEFLWVHPRFESEY